MTVDNERLAAFALLPYLDGAPRPPTVRAHAAHVVACLEASPELRARLACLEQRLAALQADAVAGFERLTGEQIAGQEPIRRRC